MDCRGFAGAEEMNEAMIEKWNARVRKKDEVVIIGDLSFGSAQETNELVRRLKGKLYLWIKPYEELSDNRRKVILCHYPVMCYNGQYRLDKDGNPKTYMLHGHTHDTHDQRLLDRFQEITRKTMVTDAQGDVRAIPCNMINCFCMYSDYTPLTLDEWIECDRKRRSAVRAEKEIAAPDEGMV